MYAKTNEVKDFVTENSLNNRSNRSNDCSVAYYSLVKGEHSPELQISGTLVTIFPDINFLNF